VIGPVAIAALSADSNESGAKVIGFNSLDLRGLADDPLFD
jgi:hypothetical protein